MGKKQGERAGGGYFLKMVEGDWRGAIVFRRYFLGVKVSVPGKRRAVGGEKRKGRCVGGIR